MTNKEKRMWKLVNYLFLRAGKILSAKKQDDIFVEVYKYFNKRNKKNKIKKREHIIKYMNSLRLRAISNDILGMVTEKKKNKKQGRTMAIALGLGIMFLGVARVALTQTTKNETED